MRHAGRPSKVSGAGRKKKAPLPRALILDAEPERRKALLALLSRQGFSAKAFSEPKKLRAELLSRGAEIIFLGTAPGKGGLPSARQCRPFTLIGIEGEQLNLRADLLLPRGFGPRDVEALLSSGLRLARLKRALHRARRSVEGFRERERELEKVRHSLNNLSMIVEGYLALRKMGHPSAKEKAQQVLEEQAERLESINRQIEKAISAGNRKGW